MRGMSLRTNDATFLAAISCTACAEMARLDPATLAEGRSVPSMACTNKLTANSPLRSSARAMPYGTLFETLEEWNGCRRDRRCRWIQARASGGRKGRGARSGAGGRLPRALEINPDSGDALKHLGPLQLTEGKPPEAASTYRKIEL